MHSINPANLVEPSSGLMQDPGRKVECLAMDSLYSQQNLSNPIQGDGCEPLPWEKLSKSELWSSKLLYAAVLYSLCIHTLVIFSMSNLALPPAPSEMKPFLFYTAYLADLEPATTATMDTPANTGADPIVPESLENENRDAPSPVSPDPPDSAKLQSPLNQGPLTAPSVIPAPSPSAKKLVSDRRKVQRTPEIPREHDTVKPLSGQNGIEAGGSEGTTAASPLKNLETAPGAQKPSSRKVENSARDLDIQQFLATNIDDIGGKVMAVLQYPAIAKRMKWQGLSSIGFVLHPSGEVTDLRVEKSSGHEILDKQAVAAVQAAAPFNGAPGEVSVILPVRFHLD